MQTEFKESLLLSVSKKYTTSNHRPYMRMSSTNDLLLGCQRSGFLQFFTSAMFIYYKFRRRRKIALSYLNLLSVELF